MRQCLVGGMWGQGLWLSCVLSHVGTEATAGSQTAVKRPAHQTCSENHEISAAAEGMFV